MIPGVAPELRRVYPEPALTTTPGEAYDVVRTLQQGTAGRRPWLSLCMIASLDGAVVVDGRSGPLGNANDRAVLLTRLVHWLSGLFALKVGVNSTDTGALAVAEEGRRRAAVAQALERTLVALLRFVVDIKSGKDEVTAPTYSHLTYDVVPDQRVVVTSPDIVILEGLNVLQPARVRDDGRAGLTLSDFFDFSVYVDARTEHIREWYIERFKRLRETAFQNPESYFAKYGSLSEEEAVDTAARLWDTINGPNLTQNVLPTRSRATLVLRKDLDHSVRYVRLRKL